jgi:hypothetical protein
LADSFSLDVDKWIDAFEDGAEETVRTTVIKLWSAVIKATPVDDGRARAGWFASGRNESARLPGGVDKSKDGAVTALNAAGVVQKLQDWSVFTLTNNLPYIEVIEYGRYPDPVKLGTRVNQTGSRQNPIKPIYEKMSKSGYSKQAPSGMVRVNIKRFNRLLELEARRRLPK